MKRLIDHIECGGSGCRGCKDTGTELREVERVAFLKRARTEEEHEAVVREACSCYQGMKVNEGVAQCLHADHRDGGEWCDLESCPLPAAIPVLSQGGPDA